MSASYYYYYLVLFFVFFCFCKIVKCKLFLRIGSPFFYDVLTFVSRKESLTNYLLHSTLEHFLHIFK